MPFVEQAAAAESVATVAAIAVGGAWAIYQYVIKRAGETGLLIKVKPKVTPWTDPLRTVFIDVTLKNTGRRRLDASPATVAELQREHENSVRYPASLQIRRVVGGANAVVHLDWWEEPSRFLSGDVVPEICLLTEYLDAQGKTGFFMEPKEEYHIGAALLLERGTYLGKVVFIGSRGASEYWSRIFAFDVS